MPSLLTKTNKELYQKVIFEQNGNFGEKNKIV